MANGQGAPTSSMDVLNQVSAADQPTAQGATSSMDVLNQVAAGTTPQASAPTPPTTSDAVFGPTTAMGAPMSPALQQEGSGVSDIVHGNIRHGLGKIWDAETGHVIPGSPLEKAIQLVKPDFHGAATPEMQAQNDIGSKPMVDVAQFIDKQQHPIGKAIAETAQSLTSPDNVAVMVATGGLGLVDSPVALGMANKLVSAGFSTNAIASAYKNLKSFKAAYDKGDETEAKYQLTHAVLGGTLAAVAAHGATGGGKVDVGDDTDFDEVSSDSMLKNAADKTGITTAANAVGDAVNTVRNKVSDVALSVIKPQINKMLGVQPKQLIHNAEPAQGIIDEGLYDDDFRAGLIGGTTSLLKKVEDKTDEIGGYLDHIAGVADSVGGPWLGKAGQQGIDLSDAVDAPIDKQIAEVNKSALTPTERVAAVKDLNDLRTGLHNTTDADGKLQPRQPDHPGFANATEAVALKRSIGDSMNWTRAIGIPHQDFLEKAMKDIYGKLAEGSNEIVDRAYTAGQGKEDRGQAGVFTEFNQRYSNIVAAKIALQRQALKEKAGGGSSAANLLDVGAAGLVAAGHPAGALLAVPHAASLLSRNPVTGPALGRAAQKLSVRDSLMEKLSGRMHQAGGKPSSTEPYNGPRISEIPSSPKPKGSAGAAEANSDEFAQQGQPYVLRDKTGTHFIEDQKTGKWVPLTDDIANKKNVQALLDQGFMPDQVIDMLSSGKPGDAPYATSKNPLTRWLQISKEKMAEEDAREAELRGKKDQLDAIKRPGAPAPENDQTPQVPPRSQVWGPEPVEENPTHHGTEIPLRDDMTDEEFEDMRQKLVDWFKENGGQEPGTVKGQGEGGPIPGMIRRDSGDGWQYKNPLTGKWQSWKEVWKSIHGDE